MGWKTTKRYISSRVPVIHSSKPILIRPRIISAFILTDCVKMVNLCPRQQRLVSWSSVFAPKVGVPGGNEVVPHGLPLITQTHRWTVFCRADRSCPAGQIYRSCPQGEDDDLHPGRGVACERTCESYLLNLTCSTHEPCVAGCACPSG